MRPCGSVGQLADDRFPVIIDVDADNLIAGNHDVVNADLPGPAPTAAYPDCVVRRWTGFIHNRAQFIFFGSPGRCWWRSVRMPITAMCMRVDGIQQPHQRHHQHCRAPTGSCWGGDLFRIEGGDGLRQHFGKYQHLKVKYAGGDRDAGVAALSACRRWFSSAEARMLTRLLPISTRLIRRSGLRSSFSTRLAGGCLVRHVAQPVAVPASSCRFREPEK